MSTSNPPRLRGRQLRHLRALAHSLQPIVLVGKNGWSEGLKAEIDAALLAHELIKIKVGTEAPLAPGDLALHVENENGAATVQVIGRTLVSYLRHPNKPKIELPKRTRPTPSR